MQDVQMHILEHYIVLTSRGKRAHFQKKSGMTLHQIIFHMKLTSLEISREMEGWGGGRQIDLYVKPRRKCYLARTYQGDFWHPVVLGLPWAGSGASFPTPASGITKP